METKKDDVAIDVAQFLVIYRLVDLSNWVSSTRKISLRRVRIMRIMIKNNYNEQTMSLVKIQKKKKNACLKSHRYNFH